MKIGTPIYFLDHTKTGPDRVVHGTVTGNFGSYVVVKVGDLEQVLPASAVCEDCYVGIRDLP